MKIIVVEFSTGVYTPDLFLDDLANRLTCFKKSKAFFLGGGWDLVRL